MGYALRRTWLPLRVATLPWNQWQLCRGMSGRFAMESVATFAWNRWQLCRGISGNFRAEYARKEQFQQFNDYIRSKRQVKQAQLGKYTIKSAYQLLMVNAGAGDHVLA